jgi:hypothetical protein
VSSCETYGNGHINDTWLVTCNNQGKKVHYILQRINHTIFKNVPALMENVDRVCSHMRTLGLESGAVKGLRRPLTLCLTHEQKSYYQDKEGNFWRVYDFIEDTVSVDVLESDKQAYEAAKSFGAFQRCLSNLPGNRLNETIPNFHNTVSRFAVFKEMVRSDPEVRTSSALIEIEFVLNRESLAAKLLVLMQSGAIAERITHNDTKINNVLLDAKTGEGVCVIDLDTVMPGLGLYDFGDMVRSASNSAAEDEVNLDLVKFRMPIFEALVRGYLSGAGDMLNESEKAHLPTAAQVITFENGMRFLTDYLNGDKYFKIKQPLHNLERARNQFALLRSMENHDSSMHDFVAQFAS